MDRSAFKEYVELVADSWRALLIGLVFTLVGIGLDIGQTTGIILIHVSVQVGRVLWIAALIAIALVAPFQAFQKVQRERDEARNMLAFITRTTADSPIRPSTELRIDFETSECGVSGDGDYPGRQDGRRVPIVRVAFGLRANEEVTIEAIALDIANARFDPLDWATHRIGPASSVIPARVSNVQFPIPGVARGNHTTHILAFAEGRWWTSGPFDVVVPPL